MISTGENSIFIKHCNHIGTKFSVSITENQQKLPTFYNRLPMLHKRPYKAHFLANFGSCTNTSLSNITSFLTDMSPVMRKPTFCICENKDADQLRGNREADQRLCFRYTDSTIHLLSKSEISSIWSFSVAVQPGLCRTMSKTRTFVFS